jgi:hypothetical protein
MTPLITSGSISIGPFLPVVGRSIVVSGLGVGFDWAKLGVGFDLTEYQGLKGYRRTHTRFLCVRISSASCVPSHRADVRRSVERSS